jgi:hypothetical protein
MRIIKSRQQREGIRALANIYALALEGAEKLTSDEETLKTVQDEVVEGVCIIAKAIGGNMGSYYLIGELTKLNDLKEKDNLTEESPIVKE